MSEQTPGLDEQITQANVDLLNATTFRDRTDAAERLDALNAQKLAGAFTQRDAQAAAQLAPALGGTADLDTRSPAERLGLA